MCIVPVLFCGTGCWVLGVRLVLYCTILCCAVLYCTVVYCTCTAVYCTVLYCAVLYCTKLYCAALYCTVRYSPVLDWTVLDCSGLFFLYCTGLLRSGQRKCSPGNWCWFQGSLQALYTLIVLVLSMRGYYTCPTSWRLCVPCVNRPFEWEIHGSVNLTTFCCVLRLTWCHHRVRFLCYLCQKAWHNKCVQIRGFNQPPGSTYLVLFSRI